MSTIIYLLYRDFYSALMVVGLFSVAGPIRSGFYLGPNDQFRLSQTFT